MIGLLAEVRSPEDGFLDLFVVTYTGRECGPGKNLLFHNNGNGSFTKSTSGRIASDVGVAFGRTGRITTTMGGWI